MYQERYEEQYENMHINAWVQGQYMVAAIAASFDGKKNPYPEEPFGLEKKEEENQETDKLAAIAFEAWAGVISKDSSLITENKEVEFDG